MSAIFLFHFLLIMSGEMDPQTMQEETFYVWALFDVTNAKMCTLTKVGWLMVGGTTAPTAEQRWTEGVRENEIGAD